MCDFCAPPCPPWKRNFPGLTAFGLHVLFFFRLSENELVSCNLLHRHHAFVNKGICVVMEKKKMVGNIQELFTKHLSCLPSCQKYHIVLLQKLLDERVWISFIKLNWLGGFRLP